MGREGLLTVSEPIWYTMAERGVRTMQSNALRKIEEEISQLGQEEQQDLLADLPHILKTPLDDMLLLKVSEKSFDFWNNPEDAAYDKL